jgi:hypothetical protein
MDLMEPGWEGVEWICVLQDRDWWWTEMNAVIKLWDLATWTQLLKNYFILKFVTFYFK